MNGKRGDRRRHGRGGRDGPVGPRQQAHRAGDQRAGRQGRRSVGQGCRAHHLRPGRSRTGLRGRPHGGEPRRPEKPLRREDDPGSSPPLGAGRNGETYNIKRRHGGRRHRRGADGRPPPASDRCRRREGCQRTGRHRAQRRRGRGDDGQWRDRGRHDPQDRNRARCRAETACGPARSSTGACPTPCCWSCSPITARAR